MPGGNDWNVAASARLTTITVHQKKEAAMALPSPQNRDLVATEAAEKNLMAWLRDASAMEEQAATMMSTQIARLEHYPHLKRKLEEHLAETHRQSARIKTCIARRGGDTSTLKELAAKTMAFAQGLSGIFVDDEVVKGMLASYTFEQMEIASYRILIAAADAVGDSETAATCREILAEEQAMADWLAEETPSLVTKFLKRDSIPGVEAKH